MKDNPYSKMIELIKKEMAKFKTPVMQIGKVISSSPLNIQSGDLVLGENDVIIAEHVTIVKEDRGKRVLLLPMEDRQTYIILAKLKG